MTPRQALFSLLRAALRQEPVPPALLPACTPAMLEQLYALSSKHDLAHLICLALEPLDLPDCPAKDAFQRAKSQSIFRYMRHEHALSQIAHCLETAQIAYLPLKGAVIRGFYPQPWMRTSCDIDILVRQTQLDEAVQCLSAAGWKVEGKKHYHDISLFSSTGVHLELHFSILEDTDHLDGLLAQVWDYAQPAEGSRWEMTPEFFLLHQIAHMSYHFVGGGCGIRPFADVWLLQKGLAYDKAALAALLEQCRLTEFYSHAQSLMAVWFEGADHSPLTEKMENYLLTGGVYGSAKQRIAHMQKEKGGKLGYLRYRLFMPLEHLKIRYPILKKHPWLYPACQIARWFSVLLGGRLGRSLNEARTNQQICPEESEQVLEFLQQVGLKPEN